MMKTGSRFCTYFGKRFGKIYLVCLLMNLSLWCELIEITAESCTRRAATNWRRDETKSCWTTTSWRQARGTCCCRGNTALMIIHICPCELMFIHISVHVLSHFACDLMFMHAKCVLDKCCTSCCRGTTLMFIHYLTDGLHTLCWCAIKKLLTHYISLVTPSRT